ncbi:MAG: DNA repair protein RecO [Planctomycetota bacterium]|jgi:DNA repair protein RecO (recombination protein O)
MLNKDSAICIRAIDYSETSQIVTFFTRAGGKIDAIAKGSKRPKSSFDGPIEIFSHGKIVFADSAKGKLATLTEFEQRLGFAGLCSNLYVLNCASLGAELLNSFTHEHDPHPELFDSFLLFLDNCNQSANKPRDAMALLILFELTLLKEAGLRPVIDSCVNCGSTYKAGWPETYFSSVANGLICRDCEAHFPDRLRLSEPVANCLANLKRIADADKKVLLEIEKILIVHITELLGRPPKLARYVLNF